MDKDNVHTLTMQTDRAQRFQGSFVKLRQSQKRRSRFNLTGYHSCFAFGSPGDFPAVFV